MLRVGDRVQVSEKYVLHFGRWGRTNLKRVGRVTSIYDIHVKVLWDGLKNPVSYHHTFIVPANPKDDLEAALAALLGPLE